MSESHMKYKYSNLSCGYSGDVCKDLTLNAKFYSELFNESSFRSGMLNATIPLPQRIPRNGFFQELYALETEYYKKQFDSLMNKIIKNHTVSLENILEFQSNENVRNYLNWSNILIRYGKFENVIYYFPEKDVGYHQLEVLLLKATAEIEMCLSHGKSFSLDRLLELAERFIDCIKSKDYGKIKLLNQLIVYFHRYQKGNESIIKIFNWSKSLLSLLKKYETNNFLNAHLCSIAYRGLAMVPEFGIETQSSFLNKAYNLAIHIQPKTEIEKVVALENQFTCKQSIAKWNLRNNKIEEAEASLIELTLIDPYDSTGFSELGLFYIQLENYAKASQFFYKALELGPPGVGMNTYYYAKCLEQLGETQDSIKYLHKTTEVDKEAISPWLDLMSLYEKNNNENQCRHIANFINTNKVLMEQMEDNEIAYIKNFLN
jgi:tetratricopeptide (TPR) repeat protein